MNKKRNLAVVMAAATVATSVAPVFAAEVKDFTQDDLVKEVEKLLNTKYSDPAETNGDGEVESGKEYRRSVYKIEELDKDNKVIPNSRITDIHDLKSQMEQADLEDRDFHVLVTDKGHNTVNGSITKQEYTKYEFIDSTELAKIATDYAGKTAGLPVGVRTVTALDIDGDAIEAADYSDKLVTVEMKLLSGKTIEFASGDYKVDFNKPVEGNDVEVDPTTTDDNVLSRINGFKKLKNAEDKEKYITKASSIVGKYTVGSTTTIKENLDKFYTSEDGYTDKGEDLVNTLIDADADQVKGATYVLNGARYTIKYSQTDNNKIKTVNDGYELTIEFTAKKGSDNEKPVKYVLKSDNKKDLDTIVNAITNGTKVSSGKVTSLSGTDRFETAVEISKEAFLDYKETGAVEKKAKAVVLVGENAIVDGLASAPLAKAVSAPILLTKANEVPQMTMKEIERVVDEDCDVYLIGGTNTISKDVEKQLINKLNANVVRVSGEDRYATSAEIADELQDHLDGSKQETAYVVGGDGLADAMSVASIAAEKNAPILVTQKDALTRDVKDQLKDMSDLKDVTIVGGTTKVSTKVLKDIQDDNKIAGKTTRLSGADRADTNAAVLNSHFKTKKNTMFIAKNGYAGGDGQLIDALAIAPFAATKQAPVVLAGDKLSSDQDDFVKTVADKNAANKLYQVGQGLTKDVIKVIVDHFDL
ncbi:cell wall-binding repeat-containing protein [Clostridioides mangenotii]|uniref:cell wall-binding repeat-containing protein n=1 Tax=Metaclostridioides mangenotii TaxID=1540 RepID=UPI001C10D146|nr:cell wall-binding repeat-containing protein [Clostridioides mangenotii]MBU5306863.1 cell wall-binding repeat-containing protein [Clostridioides mangenotii]